MLHVLNLFLYGLQLGGSHSLHYSIAQEVVTIFRGFVLR